MNLFFGGSLGGLMKPHFYRKISPVGIIRSMVRQNVLCKHVSLKLVYCYIANEHFIYDHYRGCIKS